MKRWTESLSGLGLKDQTAVLFCFLCFSCCFAVYTLLFLLIISDFQLISIFCQSNINLKTDGWWKWSTGTESKRVKTWKILMEFGTETSTLNMDELMDWVCRWVFTEHLICENPSETPETTVPVHDCFLLFVWSDCIKKLNN